MLKHIDTLDDYAEYEERVEKFFESEGILNLSQIDNKEPFFSMEPCDVCKRPLGGERFPCSGYNPKTNRIYCYNVCPDCLYYAEYGQLDDETMLRIEGE